MSRVHCIQDVDGSHSRFELEQVALNTRLDLFQALGHLRFRKIPPRSYLFKLASTNGNPA